jgi:hypothetical protein
MCRALGNTPSTTSIPTPRLTFAATGIGFTVYGVSLAQDTVPIDAG